MYVGCCLNGGVYLFICLFVYLFMEFPIKDGQQVETRFIASVYRVFFGDDGSTTNATMTS